MDLSLLNQVVKTYDTQIDTLETAYSEANRGIEALRDSAWKTDGSDAFFQNYDNTWKKELRDHIDYLKHLRDCLKIAQEGFYEEYNKKIF